MSVPENKDYQRALTAKALDELMSQKRATIEKLMPRGVDRERLISLVFAAYRQTPAISQCSPMSVLNAIFTAAQLGLEFNTLRGHGWLVPRWNGKTKRMECQFQPGYRGLVDLAYRSDKVTTINAALVHDADEFEWEEGTNPKIRHKKSLRDAPGDWYAAYAIVHPKEGPPFTNIMRRDEIMAIRDKCAPKNKKGELVGPWVDWEEAMALKTCVKPPLKLAPCSIELADAIGLDDEIDALHTPPEVINVETFEGLDVDPHRLLEGGEAPPEGSKEEQQAVLKEKLKQAKARFKGLSEDQKKDLWAHAESLFGNAMANDRLHEALNKHGYETVDEVPSTGLADVVQELEEMKQ